MSETQEDQAVRQELEAIAARSRAAAAAEPATPEFERITAGIAARAAAAAKRRELDIGAEADRAAAGERPQRMDHESREDWLGRLSTWEATPAGRVWVAARARAERERADSERRADWPKVVESAGVPALLADLVWVGRLEATDPLVEARRAPFGILVLGGKIGVGKSVAAAWWLLAPHLPGAPIERRRSAIPSLWVSAARLARWERYDDAEMNRLLRAPRLVIDDLYAEFSDSKGNFLAMLDEVINERLSNGRPIVITTNASKEDFKSRYEGRIADRIREHGRFHVSAGESMRRRSA